MNTNDETANEQFHPVPKPERPKPLDEERAKVERLVLCRTCGAGLLLDETGECNVCNGTFRT